MKKKGKNEFFRDLKKTFQGKKKKHVYFKFGKFFGLAPPPGPKKKRGKNGEKRRMGIGTKKINRGPFFDKKEGVEGKNWRKKFNFFLNLIFFFILSRLDSIFGGIGTLEGGRLDFEMRKGELAFLRAPRGEKKKKKSLKEKFSRYELKRLRLEKRFAKTIPLAGHELKSEFTFRGD